MQCRTCHDPHDNINGKFLVVANTASALCQTCHVKNFWTQSDHRNSTRTWNGTGDRSVAAHERNDGGRQRLRELPPAAHGGRRAGGCSTRRPRRTTATPATTATWPEERAVRVHLQAIAPSGRHHDWRARSGRGQHHHDAARRVRRLPQPARGCGRRRDAVGPARRRRVGVTGSPARTSIRRPASTRSASAAMATAPACRRRAPRGRSRRSTRGSSSRRRTLRITRSLGAGRSANVPSLIAPLTTSSVIKCTDCHNNNAGPAEPAAPVRPVRTDRSTRRCSSASTWSPTTRRKARPPTRSATSATAGPASSATRSFREHNKHIDGERTPCNVCHDPHGISSTQGNTVNNSRLINFDTTVVLPSSSGARRFESTGTNAGRCYLTCHGKNHNPLSY